MLNMLKSLRANVGVGQKNSSKTAQSWRPPAPAGRGDEQQEIMSLEEELAFFMSATGCDEEQAVEYLGSCDGVAEALESWWELHPEGVAPVSFESTAGRSNQPQPPSRSVATSVATAGTRAGPASSNVSTPVSGGYASGHRVEPPPAPAMSQTPARTVDRSWYSRARGEWVNPDSKETDRDRYLRQIEEARNKPSMRSRPRKSGRTFDPTRNALANIRNPRSYF